MNDFIERLQDESDILDKKIMKLQNFVTSETFEDIEISQQSLLNIQLFAMLTYAQCLTERLFWLETEKENED